MTDEQGYDQPLTIYVNPEGAFETDSKYNTSGIPEGETGVAIHWATTDGVPSDENPVGIKRHHQYLRWESPCFRGFERGVSRGVALAAYAAVAAMHPIPARQNILCEIRV